MRKILFSIFIFYSHLYIAQDECGQAGGYTGVLKQTHSNGARKEENSYLNGVKHGICLSFYLDGTIRSKEKYQMGRLIEVFQSADAAHDAKDYNTLHPHRKQEYTYPKPDPNNKKWKSNRIKINDSTESETCYFDNKLAIERKFIKGDKRYERFYYRAGETYDSYFNRNYEAHYYYGKLHGETISYFNNGNIQRKANYQLQEPIGSVYNYYNNKQHTIKSITYYPDLRSPLYKRNYDTTGAYSGYELINRHYSGAFKTVVYTDTSGKNTWSLNTYYYHKEPCIISGVIENGNYKITEAQTKSKKNIFKNGKYVDVYVPFMDVFNQKDDTVLIPSHKGSHTTFISNASKKIAPVEFVDYIMNYVGQSNFNMFTVPLEKWKGHFKNGYLDGEWELKSNDLLYFQIPVTYLFTGKFEKSRREGIWHYENNFYQYDINYVNGKKEGELKLNLKKYDMKKVAQKQDIQNERYDYREGDTEYFPPQNLPETYYNLLSLMVGSFKNDELDGEWLVYYRYPDLLAFKAIYSNGILIGKTEEYNIKQQLTAKRIINNNKIISEKLYTPSGDEYDAKYLTSYQENYKLLEMKDNKENGRFIHWNNYTGDFIEKGFYEKGMKNKEWVRTAYGDTLIQNYRNDTLQGAYKHINRLHRKYQLSSTGSYDRGKQSGLWKHTNTMDSIYKEEVFMDHENYLTTYIYKNKKLVEQGNGLIVAPENGLLIKTEEYYKDGKNFKTILIYNQTNQIASIIYNTPHGDSIAYYMPPESGTCIKNGTGLKTYFDDQKRISKIEYYEKGKIIKHDIYTDGQFDATYYFHYINDTSKTNSNVIFEKDVTKSYTDHDYLWVTLRVKNIPKNTSVLYVYDSHSALSAYDTEITNAEYFTVKKEGGTLSFQPKKILAKNFIEIKYKMPYYKNVNHHNNSTQLVIETTDKTRIVIFPRYPVK